ncbi:C2H2 type zinc-finger-domain-containing protein [Paraphoma chrysanthemicola]|nr:C2H2 type zinc-finger-domain-containing protein [Paraphoma chrysanthemicola]
MASKRQVFPCNTCSITFTTSELQRSHMRQSWHINNLRRRVAGLPALSEEQFGEEDKSQEAKHRRSSSEEQREPRASPQHTEAPSDSNSTNVTAIEQNRPTTFTSTQCLFCTTISPTLDENMSHMSSVHGLFVPSPERLLDLPSFLGYLATIIFDYNECLYCGATKANVKSVQTHMRDKGHCMIHLDPDSELLDFWELSDSEGEDASLEEQLSAVKLSDTELRLPSGAIINSRSDTTHPRTKPSLAQTRSKSSQQRIKRDERRAITAAASDSAPAPGPDSRPSHTDHRVAVRGEMGLAGVSEAQKRALVVTEKRMRQREAVAKAAMRHAIEQQPQKTIYYKTENPVYQAG